MAPPELPPDPGPLPLALRPTTGAGLRAPKPDPVPPWRLDELRLWHATVNQRTFHADRTFAHHKDVGDLLAMLRSRDGDVADRDERIRELTELVGRAPTLPVPTLAAMAPPPAPPPDHLVLAQNAAVERCLLAAATAFARARSRSRDVHSTESEVMSALRSERRG